MKRIIQSIIIFHLLFFLLTNTCIANVTVSPPELSITMTEELITGNTTKKITITNDYNTSVNVSWYKEHPNPLSWMRPNRSCIPNISWIDIQPIWKNIPGNSNASFFIYLQIPDEEDNYNQTWESWITFRLGQQGFANYESAVRLYIDTPLYSNTNNTEPPDIPSNPSSTNEAILGVFLITIFCIFLLMRKKKQTN